MKELKRLDGMTLIAEDTQIRPAAMSHVKPSEFRYYAMRALRNAAEECEEASKARVQLQENYEDACTRIATLAAEVERLKGESEEARANLLLQTICRLPSVLTTDDWQDFLEEHRHEWLNDDRAFGGWVSQRLSVALATARADVLREVREATVRELGSADMGAGALAALACVDRAIRSIGGNA